MKKEAMGYFLDGKASAVFGTHTHVQTADEQILPEDRIYNRSWNDRGFGVNTWYGKKSYNKEIP